MKPRVYIETTVVSYLTARPSRDVISLARQEITRVWWRCKASGYERVISQLVLSEAAAGDAKAARERLAAISDLPLLESSPEITRLAERFVRPDCIPAKAKDDAMHLAFCAVHAVPYLLTWNFRHLANPDNRRRLRLLCESAGYEPPSICTPDEIMKGEL
jgi:hypothetical protein